MKATTRATRSCRGAVLAEVIMMTVVSGLLLSVMSGFYLGYIKIWQRDTGRMGAVKRADFALRRMQKEIRNAKSITISDAGQSLTVVLPKRRLDTELGRMVNDLDSSGQLMDGERVQYYFAPGSSGSSNAANAIYRRVRFADGTEKSCKRVVDRVYPELNPLIEGTSTPRPIFSYDSGLRMTTATVTAAEPRPSTARFAVRCADARCERDGGRLVRAATSQHPEGEIHCVVCGRQVKPNVEIETYETQLWSRNR